MRIKRLITQAFGYLTSSNKADYGTCAEMLYAVGRYEPVLHYYKLPIIEGKHTKVMFKGSIIKAYLAHILVCKCCHKYLILYVKGRISTPTATSFPGLFPFCHWEGGKRPWHRAVT
jgi:hypothetical protein